VGPEALALWARLPWGVLVTRQVAAGGAPEDRTVAGTELLAALGQDAVLSNAVLSNRDSQWRWPLPSGTGVVLETIPADEIQRLGAAAARTLHTAGTSGVAGQAVGERALRDALLDHVPIVVDDDGGRRIEVSQRLVQAVLRMGFLGPSPGGVAPGVSVCVTGGWVGLAAGYGTAWRQNDGLLAVRVAR
jgi:hypothetical protein